MIDRPEVRSDQDRSELGMLSMMERGWRPYRECSADSR